MISKIAKVLVMLVIAAIGVPVFGAFLVGFMAGAGSEHELEGTFEENVFVNIPTQWRFVIPDGWSVQSAEEQAARYEASKKLIAGQVDTQPVPRANQSGELALSKADMSSFNFKANPVDPEKAPGLIETVIGITQASYQQYAEKTGARVKQESTNRVIDGKEFIVAKFQIWAADQSSILLTNINYLRLEGENRFILMTTNCASEQSCEEITSAIETSKFS